MKTILTVTLLAGAIVVLPVFAGPGMGSESGMMSMQEREKKMNRMMEQARKTKDPKKKEQLMHQHMMEMRGGMMDMMHGKGMMMGKGEDMSEKGMEERMDMMDSRMGMMQMMMDQMMQHQEQQMEMMKQD